MAGGTEQEKIKVGINTLSKKVGAIAKASGSKVRFWPTGIMPGSDYMNLT